MTDIEKPLRDKIRKCLEGDFLVYENWEGFHRNNKEKIRYDLILEPKQHLLDAGFDKGYVIVEAKLFNNTDSKKHDLKAKDLLWQCVVYSYSDIKTPQGELHKPLFVLYYIGGDGVDKKYEDKVQFLHSFVLRGGVGSLKIDSSGHWAMVFGGSYYYRKVHGRGPHNVGVKRMTGYSR